MQALIAAAIVLGAVLIGGAIGTLKFRYDQRILKPKKVKPKFPDVGDLGYFSNDIPAGEYWQDTLVKIVAVVSECSGIFFQVQKYYPGKDRTLHEPHRPSLWLNPGNFVVISRYSDAVNLKRKDA